MKKEIFWNSSKTEAHNEARKWAFPYRKCNSLFCKNHYSCLSKARKLVLRFFPQTQSNRFSPAKDSKQQWPTNWVWNYKTVHLQYSSLYAGIKNKTDPLCPKPKILKKIGWCSILKFIFYVKILRKGKLKVSY